MDTDEINVQVRGMDAGLWHRIRIASVTRQVHLATIVAEALRDWLAKHEGK